MAAPFRLVVGLGNPGSEYRATRHNAGFWVVEGLARIWGAELRPGKWNALEALAAPSGLGRVMLLEPQTYMNESGRSLAPLARFYKLAPEDVIVIHDELDLPPGRLRIKQGGGHGGHNGLRSIIDQWGEKNFYRVRVGVGRPPRTSDVVKYVLGQPSKAQWNKLDQAVIRATEAVERLLRDGLNATQQDFNRNDQSGDLPN